MPKSKHRRKKKIKKSKTPKGPIRPSDIESLPIQKKIKLMKGILETTLDFDEALRGRIGELLDISLDGVPGGMEQMCFSSAVLKIKDAEAVIKKFERFSDLHVQDEDKDGVDFVWTRAYPKGHWNPMSKEPGARQDIGNLRVSFDDTLRLEARTKSWLTGFIFYMIDVLGSGMKLIDLEFKDPMDFLKKRK